jgi:hypothetical protein
MDKRFLLISLVAVISLSVFLPRYQTDKLKGIVFSHTDERQCFNFHKEFLNDPESAYIVDSYLWTKIDEFKINQNPASIFALYDTLLKVKVKAKNKYGAYVDTLLVCPLVDGNFDKLAALILKSGVPEQTVTTPLEITEQLKKSYPSLLSNKLIELGYTGTGSVRYFIDNSFYNDKSISLKEYQSLVQMLEEHNID